MRYPGWRPIRAAIGLLLGAALLALAALMPQNGRYDIDVEPPSGRETYAEALPATIAGEERSILAIPAGTSDIRGARAAYGDRVIIEIVHATSTAALDSFVEQRLKPRLAGYGQHESSRASGRWELYGRGKQGRFYGWQNRDWLFVIEATDATAFEEAVERFAYIGQR